MNITEAFTAMLNGERVRRRGEGDIYYSPDGEHIVHEIDIAGSWHSCDASFKIGDILAEDWEIA